MRLCLFLLAANYLFAISSPFTATLGRVQNINNTDIAPLGGDVGTVWTSVQPISGTVSGFFTMPNGAGAGNTWSVYLESRALQTGVCDYTGSPNQILLGTISGASQTRATFSGISVSMAGLSCSWLHAIFQDSTHAAGAASAGSRINQPNGGLAVLYYSQSIVHLQTGASGGITPSSSTLFCGQLCTQSASNRAFWWVPYTTNHMDGIVAITDAPGLGLSWDVSVCVSTAGLTNAVTAMDLSYSCTSVGSIAGLAKYLSWSNTAIAISANRFVQIKLTCSSGSSCAAFTSGDSGNPNVGIELSPTPGIMAFTEPGSGGGDANHRFGVCHWGISDLNCGSGILLEQQYWIGPPTGMSSVAIWMIFGNASGSAFTGAGSWLFTITYSTTGLDAATDSCLNKTYNTASTYATIVAGDKSMHSSFVGVNIPANACIGIDASVSGGTPTQPANSFNWGVFGTATGVANTSLGAGVKFGAGVTLGN